MPDKKDLKNAELSDDLLNEVAGGRAIVNSKKGVTLGYEDASTESNEDTSSINEMTGSQLKKKKETETAFNLKTLK